MTAIPRQSPRPAGEPDPGAPLLDFSNLQFRYEPFPIGLARPVIEPGFYHELVASYPDDQLFAYFPKVGHKFALSEKNNPERYAAFIEKTPPWRKLHDWIKSDAFIVSVMDALRARQIDLGYHGATPLGDRLSKAFRNLRRGRLRWQAAGLSARFEFSMLPADGGCVVPHTDTPGKIVTLVISMVEPGGWDPAFGGGTDVNRHRDPAQSFNHLNRRAEFEDMEILETLEFGPNQAVIFVKTFNSWHSVRPMRGAGSKAMRRTLTINIEESL
jgi:hypothetical protein